VRTVLDRADIKPGDVVLEVGGGSGVVLREIARRTAGSNRIIDVDINPYLLREASALAKREGLAARMEFRRGSAEAIPLDDASVDVALAVASARQAGADGADRNTEDVCGGLVRHSFEPDEQDHLALLPRQAGERLIEFAKLGERFRFFGFDANTRSCRIAVRERDERGRGSVIFPWRALAASPSAPGTGSSNPSPSTGESANPRSRST
jgi:hypothetical protein